MLTDILDFSSDIIPLHIDLKVADLDLVELIHWERIIIHDRTIHQENCW